MEQNTAKADLPALSPPSLRGFCFFNSVAITTKLLQQKLNVGKVLIVDWVSSELLGQGQPSGSPHPTLPPLPRVPTQELGPMAYFPSSWSFSPALHVLGTPSSLGDSKVILAPGPSWPPPCSFK